MLASFLSSCDHVKVCRRHRRGAGRRRPLPGPFATVSGLWSRRPAMAGNHPLRGGLEGWWPGVSPPRSRGVAPGVSTGYPDAGSLPLPGDQRPHHPGTPPQPFTPPTAAAAVPPVLPVRGARRTPLAAGAGLIRPDQATDHPPGAVGHGESKDQNQWVRGQVDRLRRHHCRGSQHGGSPPRVDTPPDTPLDTPRGAPSIPP